MADATYRIDTPSQLRPKMRDAWDCAVMLVQQGPVEVVVRKPTRNDDQNRRCHAMLADIAKQAEWAGQKFPAEIWKRLCVAAWLRESGGKPMLIPALDGNGVDIIFERTSKLTVKQMASLIEWLFALGAELGVVWSDPETRSQYEQAEINAATRGQEIMHRAKPVTAAICNQVETHGERDPIWDCLKAAKREKFDHDRQRFMADAVASDDGQWTKHTEFHWSRKINGERLDYWPSRKKFQYQGRVMRGDVGQFIRKLVK